MRRMCVIGTGHVGLVTAAIFAELGYRVICLALDEGKIEQLKHGVVPFHEPGLEEMICRNVYFGRLSFTRSFSEALSNVEFAFICVETPLNGSGEINLEVIFKVARLIARNMVEPLVIIIKSTVPVGTGDYVEKIISQEQEHSIPFSIVSCPSFLKEGSAISEYLHPSCTVIGSLDRDAAERVAQLHLAFRSPILITDLRTAEMIKIASTAFLATKISFINEIANICEEVGADVKEVAYGMGFDQRIGSSLLEAGLGFGGSNIPKDLKALCQMAAEKGRSPQLLQAVIEINTDRRSLVIERLNSLLGKLDGKTVGLLGLAFEPNTDDLCDAPAIDIACALLARGARVRAYDPLVMPRAREMLCQVIMCRDPYTLALGCDALVIVTDWYEFRNLDMRRISELMDQRVIVDGRNIFDPQEMVALGFKYRGIGRGYNGK